MPLDQGQLAADITALWEDAEAAESPAACAANFAQAIGDYASGVTPPSLTVSTATAALEVTLAGAFAAPGAIAVMEVAFAVFGVTIAGGMLPAFIGTPPAGPVGFAGLAAGGARSPAETGAALAGLIHDWMTSGTATPALGGPAIDWV